MPILATPPVMLSVVSAFPATSYTQEDMAEMLGATNPVVRRLLQAPHIQKRHLLLPEHAKYVSTPPKSPSSSAYLPLTPTSTNENSLAGSPRAEPMVNDDIQVLMPASEGGSSRAEVDSIAAVNAAGTSPSPSPSQRAPLVRETRRELHMRHLRGLSTIGVDAARRALAAASVTDVSTVAVVVAVTSTGLAMPGFSAILMQHLGLAPSTLRSDIVGMGCNAGMSGLRALSMMLSGISSGATTPVHGLLVCCEICSAVYVNDDTTAAGIVNSLFGDGAVATVLTAGGGGVTTMDAPTNPGRLACASTTTACSGKASWTGIGLVDFESCTLTEYFEDMRFDVPEEHDRMCFLLSKRIPYAVGDNVATPVMTLLQRHQLQPKDIAHWVVHSGGAAVIDGVQRNLGLPEDALRHTVSVLRDYGNISSGSFLVSLERLLEEHSSSATSTPLMLGGQYVVFIAMGPGATIEVGLGRLQ